MPLLGPHDAGIHLSRLPPIDGAGRYLAVVEAAAGSRSKCKFEPNYGALVLHRVLPLGCSFPYAFGFVPSTLADDGDPLDVLVMMDEAVAPGTVVPVRLLGILEAEQAPGRDAGSAVRNDRVLAVAGETEAYAQNQTLADVAPPILQRIEQFFVFYHSARGEAFTPLGWHGRAHAEAAVQAAHESYRRKA